MEKEEKTELIEQINEKKAKISEILEFYDILIRFCVKHNIYAATVMCTTVTGMFWILSDMYGVEPEVYAYEFYNFVPYTDLKKIIKTIEEFIILFDQYGGYNMPFAKTFDFINETINIDLNRLIFKEGNRRRNITGSGKYGKI